jgi:hypothetical protein
MNCKTSPCSIIVDTDHTSLSQDTNVIQFQLMTLLASTNEGVSIVGDPDQSSKEYRDHCFRESLITLNRQYTAGEVQVKCCDV